MGQRSINRTSHDDRGLTGAQALPRVCVRIGDPQLQRSIVLLLAAHHIPARAVIGSLDADSCDACQALILSAGNDSRDVDAIIQLSDVYPCQRYVVLWRSSRPPRGSAWLQLVRKAKDRLVFVQLPHRAGEIIEAIGGPRRNRPRS